MAALTTGRQDYGILRSTLLQLRDDPRFDLRLYVGGMHLRERFGQSLRFIQQDALPVARELDFLSEPPDPATDTGRALTMVARALETDRPQSLLLVGDRWETLAAGVGATLARVPLIHLHGGEETEGAIDNAMRHALTKLSHLHLVTHEQHAARVRQMGEDPDRVVVVGAPGLDNLHRSDLPGRADLERDLQFGLEPPLVLVTMHATTLGNGSNAEVEAVGKAMACVPARYVVTQPNADSGGAAIREFWRRWAGGRSNVLLVDALGEARHWALLRLASVMLGNSSSGIIEAPAVRVPAVNVGDRQKGRLRNQDLVVDVPADPTAIAAALADWISPDGQRRGATAKDLYLPGPAAPRIVSAIARWSPPAPPRKAFHDLACR